MTEVEHTAYPGPWHIVGRTIYTITDRRVGVMETPALAAAVTLAINAITHGGPAAPLAIEDDCP